MKHNINQLLDKYWEGETSEEEDLLLKEYYRKGNISPEHLPFKDLFLFFDNQAAIQYTGTTTDRNKSSDHDNKSSGRIINIKKWIFAAAAILGLTLSAIFLLKTDDTNSATALANAAIVNGEIQDPEEALKVTREALAMVSKKFNTSTSTVKKQLVVLDKADIFK